MRPRDHSPPSEGPPPPRTGKEICCRAALCLAAPPPANRCLRGERRRHACDVCLGGVVRLPAAVVLAGVVLGAHSWCVSCSADRRCRSGGRSLSLCFLFLPLSSPPPGVSPPRLRRPWAPVWEGGSGQARRLTAPAHLGVRARRCGRFRPAGGGRRVASLGCTVSAREGGGGAGGRKASQRAAADQHRAVQLGVLCPLVRPLFLAFRLRGWSRAD